MKTRQRGISTRFAMGLCGVLLAMSAPGCGQYVKYDGEGDLPGATPRPGASGGGGGGGVVTETKGLDDFPEVDTLGHYVFAGLIAQFTEVSGDYTGVDYVAWGEDEEAMYQLQAYQATLAGVNPADLKDGSERLAYWVNGYNAGVIAGVLSKFDEDTQSFQVIAEGLNFFGERAYTFGGVALSLDQVEQLVVRGQFGDENLTQGLSAEEIATLEGWHEGVWEDRNGEVDARLHAVFNCGAIGCPNLLARAPYVYQGGQMEQQLAQATTQWLATPGKGAGARGVSKLFEWYEQDFVDDAGSARAFIERWREGGADGVDVDTKIEYDWTLNSVDNLP